MEIPKIIPIWKKIGESTHVITKQIADKYGVKTAHTGTLDPMAEGIIIILLGEERFKKYEYAKWPKTYEFEMVFGIETDTFDALGLITKVSENETNITEAELKNVLQSLQGKYKQTVPPYSAIKVRGKPLHWYARNNKLHEVDLPSREGEIYEIELLELKSISENNLTQDIVDHIKKVSLEYDLRQDEVLKQWENFNYKDEYGIAKIHVKISKGLYIRRLCQDISAIANKKSFIVTLKRIKNGEFRSGVF